ncbi:hypothetical protein I6N98_07980 [Spongiibacter nanhainus]|uniref:Uncharacterized protein n=1 Tax=Spongiibacter nanhainus TaxID=2794344 RepID=A0A7T4R3N4_9GAMM|nr:hypothetical protein [Spongiibacter nanhainus]QQD19769.1 hypothetical protein I6N98_07980 [Spongiibacter nanhainus]
MDVTHGSVLVDDRELLSNVPVYVNEGGREGAYVNWMGCLHLDRESGSKLEQQEYRLKLRDGRLGNITIRKVISTNGAMHVEVLFEGRREDS